MHKVQNDDMMRLKMCIFFYVGAPMVHKKIILVR